MKVYSVHPDVPHIRCSDGRSLSSENRTAPLAILTDVLGDEERAKRYLRFQWRWTVFDSWANSRHAHAITENEIREIIGIIDGTSSEMAASVERMKRERPDYVTDRPAPGQAYTSNPELKPNVTQEGTRNDNTTDRGSNGGPRSARSTQ